MNLSSFERSMRYDRPMREPAQTGNLRRSLVDSHLLVAEELIARPELAPVREWFDLNVPAAGRAEAWTAVA